ncbi:hypothetical protein WR25_10588 isoform B [Diploscapter pachys]|uniref:SEC7 domain-containing protein n=1 Tax=Diploscapter pachys TaxID=2018661 RepID=A0A2A2JFA8_9BILA|nr:hypothetical protein WR25_10588 isoform B [Diploscapter pachys]
MTDPLSEKIDENGSEPTGRWVGFDEIPMETPTPMTSIALDDAQTLSSSDSAYYSNQAVNLSPQGRANRSNGNVNKDGSLDIDSGRDSVATEERFEVDEHDRHVITPLPTQEMIADPARLPAGSIFMDSSSFSNQPQSLSDSKSGSASYPGVEEVDVSYLRGEKKIGGGLTISNGKILASIFPENTHCAWIIPPKYDAYSMPAILAAEGLKVPGEDFVTAMELIVNDYRFRSYATIYSRLVAGWLVLALIIMLAVLFSQSQGGWPIMIFCIIWCLALFVGFLVCAILRRQIRIGLRHCIYSANKVLLKHNVLCGIEDRGQLSCHKVVIHLMYFQVAGCMTDIERLIRIEASGGAVVFGANSQTHNAPAKDLSMKEVEDAARHLVLKYSQGYVKGTVKHRLIFPSRPTQGVSDYAPKHCGQQMCICQFIDEVLSPNADLSPDNRSKSATQPTEPGIASKFDPLMIGSSKAMGGPANAANGSGFNREDNGFRTLELSEREKEELRIMRKRKMQLISEIEQVRNEVREVDSQLESLCYLDEGSRSRSKVLSNGRKKFNQDAWRGIDYLIDKSLLARDARTIAQWMFQGDGLSKNSIGEVLGGNEPFALQILEEFVHCHDFSQMSIVDALRRFLWSFRLPGESQKIDRIMERFAQQFVQTNPGVFPNADVCHTIAYSCIMLNTLLHNPNVKDRPTFERYQLMNKARIDFFLSFSIKLFRNCLTTSLSPYSCSRIVTTQFAPNRSRFLKMKPVL